MVLFVALFALPDAGNAEHRTALAEQIKHKQIARLHTIYHLRTGILCPALNHPYSLGIDAFHGLHHCLTGFGVVDGGIVVALVERIHRVIIGLAEKLGQFVEVEFGNLGKAGVSRQKIRRTLESVPKASISDIQSETRFGIMGNHTTIAWQYGMHAQLPHTGENLFLKLLLTTIPGKGQRTTPPFEIVHLPPGKEGRTSDELAYLFFSIAEFQEHIPPHTLLTHDSQRKIDAMQCHPIDFLLPTFPIPKSHRVRECAIIEVVAQGEISLMALFLLDGRENGRQFRLHLVPGKVNTGIVLQIPVDTGGDIHPGVASYHDLRTFLVEFEKVFLTLHDLGLELRRSALVDSFQKFINGIRSHSQ